MAIFKSKLSDNYVTLPNVTIQDVSVSWEARGLLAFMLSLPSDWAIHKSWLEEQAEGCGRDKLNRIIDELITAGYLVKQQKRSDAGKFAEIDWFVYSEKQQSDDGNPDDGITANGKPANGITATTKETVLQKKQDTNKDLVSNVKNVLPQHEQTGYFLILKDGTNYEPPASQIIKWHELYPNVDITAELKAMIGWLDANPAKRKTKTGIRRFCNAWLSNSNNQPKRTDWDAVAKDTTWADGLGECFQ